MTFSSLTRCAERRRMPPRSVLVLPDWEVGEVCWELCAFCEKYFDVTLGGGCPIVMSSPLRVPPRYPAVLEGGASASPARDGGR